MIKLTYIVCVYNSASTIINTLNSIYRQPIEENEFEVIVVDDFSPDNSSELVANFAINHQNLHLVRQNENHRVGASMNLGIRMSKGEYIQVVDGDDEVDDGIIDTLNLCLAKGVDASINVSRYEDADGILHVMDIATNLEFPMSGDCFCENVVSTDPIFGGTQFYMWRRAFLEFVNHPFVENLKMEDTDWIEYHLFNAKLIGCSKYYTYKYLYNENSQLHLLSITTIADAVLQSYRRLNSCKLFKDKLPHFVSVISEGSNERVVGSLCYRSLSRFSNPDFITLYERIGNDIRRELREFQYPLFVSLFLKHKYISLSLLWSTVWVTHIARSIVRFLRKEG